MTAFWCCLIILGKFECQICFAGVAHKIIELHNVDKVLRPCEASSRSAATKQLCPQPTNTVGPAAFHKMYSFNYKYL